MKRSPSFVTYYNASPSCLRPAVNNLTLLLVVKCRVTSLADRASLIAPLHRSVCLSVCVSWSMSIWVSCCGVGVAYWTVTIVGDSIRNSVRNKVRNRVMLGLGSMLHSSFKPGFWQPLAMVDLKWCQSSSVTSRVDHQQAVLFCLPVSCVCALVYLSVCLCMSQFVFLTVCLSVYLLVSLYLSVYVSLCVSLYVSSSSSSFLASTTKSA